MEDQIKRKNFDAICRLCLEYASETTSLHPLFINEDSFRGYYGRFCTEFKESIPEIISTCIGIELDPTDKLPMGICSACEEQLIASNKFRHKCLMSNNYLLELKLKSEDDEQYDAEDVAPLHSLKPPELIIVDGAKDDESNDTLDDNEMNSSACDTAWNTFQSEDEAGTTLTMMRSVKRLVKTSKDSTKKSSVKTSITIPLVTPSTPIVPMTSNDLSDSNRQLFCQYSQKQLERRHVKKLKMCTVCGMMVKRLRDHMKIHPDALDFSCSHCSRKYLTKQGLIKHINIIHTEDSDHSNEYEYYYNKNGEKTVRKPHAKPHKWKRNVAKAQRNFGQSYITAKGIEKPEKKVKEPCNNVCRVKCTDKITQAQREEIFKLFWNISDLTQKRVFLIRHIEHIIPKYRRSKGLRSLNYAYFFEIDNKRIQVCKTFFTKTLDISHVFIKTAIKKLNSEKGFLEGECRGKSKKVKNSVNISHEEKS